MSTDIYATNKLYVTKFAGPASEGEDRARWQITIDREWIQMNRSEVIDLAKKILASADPRPGGDGMTTARIPANVKRGVEFLSAERLEGRVSPAPAERIARQSAQPVAQGSAPPT